MSLLAFTATRTLRGPAPLQRRGRAASVARLHDRAVGRPVVFRGGFRKCTADHGGSHPAPRKVDGAAWQAGVSPGNERLKVMLNGEPMPDAIAASDADGWVDVQVFSDRTDAGFCVQRARRLSGRVEIVRGDAA